MKYLELKRINAPYEEEIRRAISDVIDSGWYLQGRAVAAFENDYARYIGTRYCVSCANGLDALTLILRAYIELGRLHAGDEVIVPANTYIASILAITDCGLKPVLVEPSLSNCQIDDSLIEQAITPHTKALMIVHLYGQCAYTHLIADICQRHHLLLLEDNAQGHGLNVKCRTKSLEFATAFEQGQISKNGKAAANSTLYTLHSTLKKTGSLGHAAGHSFYPGKNLGALGDAGAVTTDDEQLANTIRAIANYGASRKYVHDYLGRNSRMDELQAAVLSVKLRHLDEITLRRREIASIYINKVKNPLLCMPHMDNSVWHIFPVFCECRDALQQYLLEKDIQTQIHYPIPPHRQRCYAEWNQLSFPRSEQISRTELSLPCNEAMTEEEVLQVVDALNAFEG